MEGWFILLKGYGLDDWTVEPDRHLYENKSVAGAIAKRYIPLEFEVGIAPAEVILGDVLVLNGD